MRLVVKDRDKEYILKLQEITQLCGENIQDKKFIIDSLCKHFSSSKYAEHEEYMQNNVYFDGNEVGRKQYKIYRISNRTDLISNIKLSKTSMMMQYIKNQYNEFEYRKIIEDIHEKLEQLFIELNGELSDSFEGIEFSYESNNLMDIIQSSHISGAHGIALESISNHQLVENWVYLLQEIQKNNPENMIVILEDLDHLVSREQYVQIMKLLNGVSTKYPCICVVSTSLSDYVFLNEEIITGVNIVNDEIFSLPSVEHILDFIKDKYPCEKSWAKEELLYYLQGNIHHIAKEKSGHELCGDIIEKMINLSMGMSVKAIEKINNIEKTFLEIGDVL